MAGSGEIERSENCFKTCDCEVVNCLCGIDPGVGRSPRPWRVARPCKLVRQCERLDGTRHERVSRTRVSTLGDFLRSKSVLDLEMDTELEASAGEDEAQPGKVGCRLVPVGSGSVWRVPSCKPGILEPSEEDWAKHRPCKAQGQISIAGGDLHCSSRCRTCAGRCRLTCGTSRNLEIGADKLTELSNIAIGVLVV